MKNSYEIQILGQKLTIRSEASEEHVKKISDYVNKKIHELTDSNRNISGLQAAILAALNIADDFFEFKQTKEDQTKAWVEKLSDISTKLKTNTIEPV